MKTIFPIILIVVSAFSLTVPVLILFIQFRKLDAPVRQFMQLLLLGKKNEFLIGILANLLILVGAVGLLNTSLWSKPMVITGLSILLLYVWVQNGGKIIYFKRLTAQGAGPSRQELENQLEVLVQPLKQDITKEVTFDNAFYEMAVRKNVAKSVKRIIVGTVLLLPCIFYLI